MVPHGYLSDDEGVDNDEEVLVITCRYIENDCFIWWILHSVIYQLKMGLS